MDGYWEAVPARHDRRRDRHAVAEADGTGHADAGAVQVDRRAVGAHLPDEVEHHLQDDVGTLAHVDDVGDAVEHVELAVRDGDVDAGRTDVDAQEAQGARTAARPSCGDRRERRRVRRTR